MLDFQGNKILVVDDEPDIIEFITYNLNKEGFKVESASNGKEALQKIETFHPDLVLLDVMMPIMDGLEACKLMRTEEVNNLKASDLIIDRESFMVYRGDEKIQLARKEFELLFLLASKPGKVFNRDNILEKVWGEDVLVVDRTIDVHIRKIREKIGENYIVTIKGVGYKFDN
ncbi:MAG: response regulator transcription factor [Bacteroidetes bacterium]|nr:response regulator transcription factor [Bacteroidota bacterium]